MKHLPIIFVFLAAVVLAIGSARNPDFWRTPDQKGDALLRAERFDEAAKTYTDPARIGVAQYRNGDFEMAAKTFVRESGATGAYNQGNALLMHGKYDDAITSYDRAIKLRPGWREAIDNKALAAARKATLEAAGASREEEQTGDQKPDDIVFDQKGGDNKGKPVELAQESMSDEEMRATWLRQVRTTPGDFLRAKFAYQAAHATSKEATP
jgi:Ca-activated chloride channel family protein